MDKSTKAFQLLQENNINLTVGDYLELAYTQWCNDYLNFTTCAEHIEGSRKNPVIIECLEGKLQHALEIGRALNEARFK